ncbi:hypothetical protein Nepgr_019765 [Nepenthes gracilis]|uniref:BHLH domain-containing protein n=1 Tax=Nepenthes gracilis TaxID=150966 RepID=A0AAD3XVD0_NEPGR|nr:hypothetical protein Nepgr_019765 [Nepenthes gracilis]
MELSGTASEGGEWSSFNGVYANVEADFMSQLLPECSLTIELDGGSSLGVATACWDGHESHFNTRGLSSIYSSDCANSKFCCFSQESSFSGVWSIIYPTAGQENYYIRDIHPFLAANNNSMPTDFCMMDEKYTSFIQVFPDRIEGNCCLTHETVSGNMDEAGTNLTNTELADEQHLQLKMVAEMRVMDLATKDKNRDSPNNAKKRSLILDVQKGERNLKWKKNQRLSLGGNDDEDNNGGLNGQSSRSCISEDNSCAPLELNGGATSNMSCKGTTTLSFDVKTRASRGSATDPQSLYARKRRERINERLRILQNLVPNGTKVDISTMLEEAVQYVKFLQLQIKLLSSDDLWMYAPIAYNGMDIGLDMKINAPR